MSGQFVNRPYWVEKGDVGAVREPPLLGHDRQEKFLHGISHAGDVRVANYDFFAIYRFDVVAIFNPFCLRDICVFGGNAEIDERGLPTFANAAVNIIESQIIR